MLVEAAGACDLGAGSPSYSKIWDVSTEVDDPRELSSSPKRQHSRSWQYGTARGKELADREPDGSIQAGEGAVPLSLDCPQVDLAIPPVPRHCVPHPRKLQLHLGRRRLEGPPLPLWKRVSSMVKSCISVEMGHWSRRARAQCAATGRTYGCSSTNDVAL